MLPRDSRTLSRVEATGQMRANCSVEAKLHISGRRFKVRRGTVTAGKGFSRNAGQVLHVRLFFSCDTNAGGCDWNTFAAPIMSLPHTTEAFAATICAAR